MSPNKEVGVTEKIFLLLHSVSPRPLSVNDIADFSGDNRAHINLSLAKLLREGKIKIEVSEDGNYFSYVLQDYGASQYQLTNTSISHWPCS